jgi:hypothetical protein
VIDGLEDSEDYRGFEAAVIADYDAETAVERELVLRLASLLWRLRRIIAIETDLFQIQAEILRDRRNEMTTGHGNLSNQAPEVLTLAEADRLGCNGPALSPRERTYCFLRLGNLDGSAFERGVGSVSSTSTARLRRGRGLQERRRKLAVRQGLKDVIPTLLPALEQHGRLAQQGGW